MAAAPSHWPVTQDIGDKTLQLAWSTKKQKDRLVVRLDAPGLKQRSKWLSIDEPAVCLTDLLEALEDISESDIIT